MYIWKHVIFSFWTISKIEITFASIKEETDDFFSELGFGTSSEQMKLSRFRGYDLLDVISYFVRPCRFVSRYQRFYRTCWFHLQRRRDWCGPAPGSNFSPLPIDMSAPLLWAAIRASRGAITALYTAVIRMIGATANCPCSLYV
jgi:hypothetical protein